MRHKDTHKHTLMRSVPRRWRPVALRVAVTAVALLWTRDATAQSATAQSATATARLSRAEAVAMALSRSPQVALAAADTASASAGVLVARQWENPTATASFTKSDPQQHYTLDWALDPTWVRSPRIAAAQAAREAARFRAAFVRAAVRFDVDTAYTRVQLAGARSQLSARSARDADSLLTLARFRRDAGDASTLDVELAGVFAGQVRNAASVDSMAVVTARLTLLNLMGLRADSLELLLTDSLTLAPAGAPTTRSGLTPTTAIFPSDSTSALVAAAVREVEAAAARVSAERARRFGVPSVQLGMETVSPTGPTGAMAVAGISLPLPILNRNAGAVALARADLARAEAQRTATRLATTAAVVAAQRDVNATRARAERSATLVAAADRIAALSLLAYREGASPLATVLEAQRSARETLAQFYEDLAAARTAVGLLQLLTTSTSESRP